jgi:hypothetical protein
MSSTPPNIIPIFTSRGDVDAFLLYPYLFNRQGEWIGFVTPKREVYSVLGNYVGTLTNDPRIVRKRTQDPLPSQRPPARPARIRPPASSPLPKMMGDLSHEVIDVLEDRPELLHTIDSGEMRQDMD